MHKIQTLSGIHYALPCKAVNLQTEEEHTFESTHVLCKTLKLHPWAVKQVIKGKSKSTHGWFIERLSDVTYEDWVKLDKHTTAEQRTCKNCNKTFYIKNCRKQEGKFCSRVCLDTYKSLFYEDQPKFVNGKKLCQKCKEYKEVFNFFNVKSRQCKSCHNTFYKNHGRKIDVDLMRFLSRLISRAKNSCNKRHVTFDKAFTKDVLYKIYEKQKGLCAISGQQMILTTVKLDPYKISLDRIDSDRPYTESNVQLVCWAINQMKNNYSTDQLLLWCSHVVNKMAKNK